jgi:cardiolipin synthase
MIGARFARVTPDVDVSFARALHVLADFWPYFTGALGIACASLATAHIVLHKRDVRAAIGWTGLAWLAPIAGPLLYLFLGVNRIRRRAASLRGRPGASEGFTSEHMLARQELAVLPPDLPSRLAAIARVVGTSTGQPLVGGNVVEPLVDGDEAYPAMVAAIDAATRTVGLATYIMDNDRAGHLVADALERAVARGVDVRVLVDDVGIRYSRPPIVRTFPKRGIPVARFNPAIVPFAHPYFNLRNHRKLLVVDGCIGFAGGMNIRENCLLALKPSHPTRDLHFRVEGPVVRQLVETFAFDWQFTTREALAGDGWFPPLVPRGHVVARGIPDGPDEDLNTLQDALAGALSQADHSVRIVTPYFLPDDRLVEALRIASLRGVRVDILLPAHGNLRVVEWAMMGQLTEVLGSGCRVWFGPLPFDHTKLMLVDGAWSLFGSANWDPRSLRLNFEFCVECYDQPLAVRLGALLDQRFSVARRYHLAEHQARGLPRRLRDGVARLALPYL